MASFIFKALNNFLQNISHVFDLPMVEIIDVLDDDSELSVHYFRS